MNRLQAYGWIFVAVVVTVATLRLNGQSTEDIARGKQVFATSCANSFCHGSEGGPGRGPKLRERDWQQSYLYTTIEDGIAGSAMPAWKGRLSEKEIQAVIRYILSISHEVPAEAKAPASAPSVTVAKDNAAIRGKELFFDLSNERNCGVCHRVGDVGQSVGPALSLLPIKSDSELLASILKPEGKPALQVRAASGETICGIKVGGDATTLQIYDIPPAGPPVLRTFPLNEIISRGECDLSAPHAGFSRLFTREQLADVVAFLKTNSPVKE